MTETTREKLLRERPDFKVVAMPDLYLDYLLSYPGTLEQMARDFAAVAERGGGNILGWKHTVGRGGNACNLVAQLAKLGVEVVPVLETDDFGFSMLQRSLPGVDLSHVRTKGTLSSTVSFEANYSGRRVNIMASNPGSYSEFGPENLTRDDRDLIRQAAFVCVVNWGQNQKGTELAETVFKLAREGGAVTFFDPADPSNRMAEAQKLNEHVLTSGLVDVLSVNENELLKLASVVRDESSEQGETPLYEAASVYSMLAVRVDLHTVEFSATFIDGQRVRVPCSKIEPMKVTGAGDVWNAGDVFAQGMGLDHRERITFANATAAAYLKKPGLEPASLEEILLELERLVLVSES